MTLGSAKVPAFIDAGEGDEEVADVIAAAPPSSKGEPVWAQMSKRSSRAWL